MRVPRLQLFPVVIGMAQPHHVAVALHPRAGLAVPGLRLVYRAVLGGIHRPHAAGAALGAQVNGIVCRAAGVRPAGRDDVLCQRPGKQDIAVL